MNNCLYWAIFLAETRKYPFTLNDLSDELKHNKKAIIQLLRYDGLLLEHAIDEFKDCYDVVLAAVNQNTKALEFASERLRDYRNICRFVYEKHIDDTFYELQFMSPRFRKEYKIYKRILEYGNEFNIWKEFDIIEYFKNHVTEELIAYVYDPKKLGVIN